MTENWALIGHLQPSARLAHLIVNREFVDLAAAARNSLPLLTKGLAYRLCL
jgi:hypothetical protein